MDKDYKEYLMDGTGSINYNKGIAREYGVNVAVLLGLLCYKYDYWLEKGSLTEDGYFFVTQEDITEETGLSPFQQREALEVLKNINILQVSRRGMPSKNYYKLNKFILRSEIIKHKMCNNLTSSDEIITHHDVKKVDTTNKEITNKQITKDKEEDKSSPSLLVKKNNNKDISDSTAATSVRVQVYAAYPELAEVIIKWYEAVGIKKKLSFNQIRDKLEKLEKECNGDAKLIEQQINHSYMNGYLAWYPPKNIKKNSVSNSVSTRPGEVDKSGYRNYI